MASPTAPRRPNGQAKLLLCSLAGLVTGAVLLRVGRWVVGPWAPYAGLLTGAILVLIGAIGYGIYWQRQPAGRPADTAVLAFWHGLLRYAVAFDLSLIGWQKIFNLQFFVPLGMLDLPFSSFSGEDLTWAYFGHSYPYRCVIGALQIGGALLLLFHRTRLLGVLTLLPVLVNILLINYFYQLPVGVFWQAMIHLAALLYLLGLDYERLVTFFLRTPLHLPRLAISRPLVRLLLRLSVVYGPLLLLSGHEFPDTYPQLTGKYAVRNVQFNGHLLTARSCQDSVLTTVYLDIAHDCVFEFNDTKRRLFGNYTYDSRRRQLHVVWRRPTPRPDTLTATLAPTPTPGSLLATGQLGKQAVRFTLVKTP
ncbi:MAG: hypothetical protein ACRYFZ_25995 [Janthinobacterium lividum]